MVATKGYGLSVEDIDMSSPADMKPYLQAHQIKRNEQDILNWQLGQYVAAAISCIFPKGKYPKEPAFQAIDIRRNNGCKESKEETAVFEMKQRINLLRKSGLPESPV